MKWKKGALLIMSVAMCGMLLTSCNNKPPVEPEPSATPTATPTATPAPVVIADEEGVKEVLPDGYKRSTLTNELVTEEVFNSRPIAVMVPQDKVAQPQYNISKAGVMYECLVEGSITRTMCVIEDWQELEKIGNIRSARDYFIYWSFEWDSILLHDGGPFYINALTELDTTNNISGKGFRDKSRSAPHNEYYSADIVNKYCDEYGYDLEHRKQYFNEEHFKFVPLGEKQDLKKNYTDSKEVYTLDLKKCYPVTKTKFEYDEETGKYNRFIYGKPHMDAVSDEQVAFDNVILQHTMGMSRDTKDYRAYLVHDNTRDGWFLTGGRAIHITWSKHGDYDVTHYYDDKGKEIELSTGKTMICVLQDGDGASLESIFLDKNGEEVEH